MPLKKSAAMPLGPVLGASEIDARFGAEGRCRPIWRHERLLLTTRDSLIVREVTNADEVSCRRRRYYTGAGLTDERVDALTDSLRPAAKHCTRGMPCSILTKPGSVAILRNRPFSGTRLAHILEVLRGTLTAHSSQCGILGNRNSTGTEMRLDLESCGVRSLRDADAGELARHANNRNVWLQLRDQFPHPYTIDDARRFIAFARNADPETEFAITVGGLAVGAIGVTLGKDVERCSAEVGYWIGEPYWGRGIATRALAGLTRLVFETHDLERLYAVPFASNTASCRVLEKAGYRLEGRMRRSAIKDGTVRDQCLYAVLRWDRTA